MLERVHLQRFKKFEDVEVVLRPFTVLMGENSSGKTTVLQAINCALNSLYIRKLVTNDSPKGIVVQKEGVMMRTLPGLDTSDSREIYYGKASRGGSVPGAQAGARIDLYDDKGNIYKLQIITLFGNLNVKCVSTKRDVNNNPDLHTLPPLFISGFVGLHNTDRRRLESGKVSEIIRNLVLTIKSNKPKAYDMLVDRLAKDFDFHLDEIGFDERRDVNVKATFQDVCGDKRLSLDFNASGSGFMQVLQILAPIYFMSQGETRVVLLDEPDAHLHPNLQETLAHTLREVQRELDIQIIISTHSTSIIRAADPSEVVPISANMKVNVPLRGTTDVEDEIHARIDNYELAKSKLSGKIVFVEDTNRDILKAFDEKLGTKCFSGTNTVPVIAGRGRDDKMPFHVKRLMREWTGEDVEVHLVIDSDGMSDEWRNRLCEYAIKNNVILHLLARHEIENYLLNPVLFSRALEAKYPDRERPSLQEIEKFILQTMINTVMYNKYSFEDLLEDGIYKTAMLLGLREYGDRNKVKSEAKRIRETYENYSRFDELIFVAMGKEALKALVAWLNDEKKLNLSVKEVLDYLEPTDIPEEVSQMLEALRSNAAKPSPEGMPKILPEETGDEDSN